MEFAGKIINHNQVGGIESFIIDNGIGRGSRAAWVNTGSGLRFKVAIDRGLDIVDAFYGNHSLAFLTHQGLGAARPDSDRDIEWLTNFPGGLVTTCGLSHVGGPEGGRGVHGKYSNLAAELESIIQPDIYDARPVMSITGMVRESSLFGPNLELKRTISCELGRPVIKISDKVVNRGNTAVPLMLLYHCNFGWPLVDEGTRIVYDCQATSRGKEQDDAIFNGGGDYKICRAPIEEHDGFGEACGFVEPKGDAAGNCSAGVFNDRLGLGVTLKFNKNQLPCLTNWQHWGKGEYVTGIEPGTNFPIGQNAAKTQGKLTILEPGHSRDFALEIVVEG